MSSIVTLTFLVWSVCCLMVMIGDVSAFGVAGDLYVNYETPSGGRRVQRADPGAMWFGPMMGAGGGGDNGQDSPVIPSSSIKVTDLTAKSSSSHSNTNGETDANTTVPLTTSTTPPIEDEDEIVFYDDEDTVTSSAKVVLETSTKLPATTTTEILTTIASTTTEIPTTIDNSNNGESSSVTNPPTTSRQQGRSLWSPGVGPRRRAGSAAMPPPLRSTTSTTTTTTAATPRTKTGEVNYWQHDGPADPSASHASAASGLAAESDEQHREVQVSVKEHDRNPHPFAFSGGDSWFSFGGGAGAGGGDSNSGGWGFSKPAGGGFGGSGVPAVVEVADYQSKGMDEMGGVKEMEQEPKVEIKEHDELGPAGAVAGGGSEWFGGGGGGNNGPSSGSKAPSSSWGGMGGGGGGDPADNVWFGVEAASNWNPLASHVRKERKLSWDADGRTSTIAPADYEELDIITAPPKTASRGDIFSFVVDASFGGNNSNLKSRNSPSQSSQQQQQLRENIDIITAAPPSGKESRSSDFTWFGVDSDPSEARVRGERGPPGGASTIETQPPSQSPQRPLRPASGDFLRPIRIDERQDLEQPQFFVDSPPQPPPPPQFVPIVGRNPVPWGRMDDRRPPNPRRIPFVNQRLANAPRVEFGSDVRFGQPEVVQRSNVNGPEVIQINDANRAEEVLITNENRAEVVPINNVNRPEVVQRNSRPNVRRNDANRPEISNTNGFNGPEAIQRNYANQPEVAHKNYVNGLKVVFDDQPQRRTSSPPIFKPSNPVDAMRNDGRDDSRVEVVKMMPPIDGDDYFLEETDETQPEVVANSAPESIATPTIKTLETTAMPTSKPLLTEVSPTIATVSKINAISSSRSSVVTSKSVVTATSAMTTAKPPTTPTMKPTMKPSRPNIIISRTTAAPIFTLPPMTATSQSPSAASVQNENLPTIAKTTLSSNKSTPPIRYYYKEDGIDNKTQNNPSVDKDEIELSLVELTPSVVIELEGDTNDSDNSSVAASNNSSRAGRKFGRLPPSDAPISVVDIDHARVNDLNPSRSSDGRIVNLDTINNNATTTNFSVAAATRGSSADYPHLLSADSSPSSSSNGGLSTENLAYVLVGACCALSLISLLIVVSIVRYRRLQHRERLAQQKSFHSKHSPVYTPTSYTPYPRPQRESRLAHLNPVTWLDRSYGGGSGEATHTPPAGAVVPAVDLAPSSANRGRFWFMGRSKQSPYSLCDQHLSYCGNPGYSHDAPITMDYMNLTQSLEAQPLAGSGLHPVTSSGIGGAQNTTYRSGFNGPADLRHASGLESMNKGEMIYWSSNNEQLI